MKPHHVTRQGFLIRYLPECGLTLGSILGLRRDLQESRIAALFLSATAVARRPISELRFSERFEGHV
eukprot:9207970-Pyramimonas_sp.AAC.1